MLSTEEIELKKAAALLTASMLDNHSGDWDGEQTAQAFRTIYQALRDT